MMHETVPPTAPFPGFRHSQSSDIEEHAQQFSGWQCRYDQVTPGRFAGSVTELHLEGMQVARDQANQAIVKNGNAWSNAVTFSLPLKTRDPDFHCDGHAVSGPCLLTAQSDRLPEVRAPAYLDLLRVTIDESLLEAVQEHQQRSLNLPTEAHCYRLSSHPDGDELTPLVLSVMQGDSPRSQALLTHAAIRSGFRDMVLMHFLELIDNERITLLAPHARKRIVDRACDYALAHCDAPPSIVDLCNRVGASRRKLQYCFQETLGINPVAYLRALRLNAAHRDLLQAGESRNVQDIAAHWGFWHLSRFAADYRRLFGECPSDTLQRAKRDFAEYG
ncbi:helix-turn-helix domain-containing protein [Halomonas faecis]|uniref:helix-turn-helix domain-containing protein n=1 Tax=Halomonas faecis TaxID=1562110 RepID=UPI001F08CCB9|nr:helix-turn-helix domain-containing protein [Halomonas faecis]